MGHGLLRFTGSLMLLGRGLWSISSQLFGCTAPFIKKAFLIAKPHLILAARNIALDIIRAALSLEKPPAAAATDGQQEASWEHGTV